MKKWIASAKEAALKKVEETESLRKLRDETSAKLNEVKQSEHFQRVSEQAKVFGDKAWVLAAGGANDFTTWLSQTNFAREINTFSSEVSIAMDAGYLDPLREAVMSPSNHRILDGGHTISESLARAFEVGSEQGLSNFESFVEWGKAYLTDLSSPGGMPAFEGLTDNIYEFLKVLGFSDKTAIDLVTVNGQEAVEALVGGSLMAVSLVFAWKNEDKETFSRAVAAMGLSAFVAMNPLMGLIALVALAIGFNQSMIDKNAVARGGIISGAAIAISFLIPGPALLGIIPAIVVAVYLNKKLKRDVPVSQQMGQLAAYLRSDEFKQTIKGQFEGAQAHLDQSLELFKEALAKRAS